VRACGMGAALVVLLAAWAVADEGSIVCLRSGIGRLEAISPDGSQRVVRLEDAGGSNGLAVAPDGHRVAVALGKAGPLCVLEPGRPLRHLCLQWSVPDDELPRAGEEPMWTLDGEGLVFVSGETSVWATGADGSNLRLLNTGEDWVRRLGFDLDGKLLVERWEGSRFTVDVETGETTELNLSEAEAEALWALSPVRSSDGSRTAYHWHGDVFAHGANGQTTNLTQSRLGSVWPLFWTPGGEAVVCRAPSGKVWEVALDPVAEPRLLTRRAVPEAQVGNGWVQTVWTAVPVEDWVPPPGPWPPAIVNVTSKPSGADVFIDKHYKGRTPLQAQILSVGEMGERHTIAVVKDNLEGVVTDVLACQGQSQDVHVALSEPLTNPRWPPEVAHVRSEVRRAILRRSPQLLGQFSAPEVIFDREESAEGEPTTRQRFRGRLPFPAASKFLFGEFRSAMLDSPDCFEDPSTRGDRGWHAGFGGGFGCSLSIEKQDGKWCITRVWEWHGDQ